MTLIQSSRPILDQPSTRPEQTPSGSGYTMANRTQNAPQASDKGIPSQRSGFSEGVGNTFLLNGYQPNPQDHHHDGRRPLPDGQPDQQPVQQLRNGSNVRMGPDNGTPLKACSTCCKRFTRRSDLTRHGMYLHVLLCTVANS